VGLITGLLTLPLAPVRGTVWVAEQVRKQAEEELYDPARIRAQIAEIDRRRSTGEISDEEATAWEDELVDRLVAGQSRREGRQA
jgi:chorismate mutase